MARPEQNVEFLQRFNNLFFYITNIINILNNILGCLVRQLTIYDCLNFLNIKMSSQLKEKLCEFLPHPFFFLL